MEQLSEEECARLLGSQSLGRIAIVVDGKPQIFPVNYAYDDGVVVFRTAPGLKLDRGPMTAVAFEIDHVDDTTGVAWSVVAHGTAQRVTDSVDERAERLRHLTVEPAAPGDRKEWIAVYVAHLSGRRFEIAQR